MPERRQIMSKAPQVKVIPEGERDPALGINAAGGPGALPQQQGRLPHADDDERGDELAAEDWLADPAEDDTVYRLDRAEAPSDGFVVVMVRRTADSSVLGDDPDRGIFETEEEAQAEADRRNNQA
jgi:hypothetical protein